MLENAQVPASKIRLLEDGECPTVPTDVAAMRVRLDGLLAPLLDAPPASVLLEARRAVVSLAAAAGAADLPAEGSAADAFDWESVTAGIKRPTADVVELATALALKELAVDAARAVASLPAHAGECATAVLLALGDEARTTRKQQIAATAERIAAIEARCASLADENTRLAVAAATAAGGGSSVDSQSIQSGGYGDHLPLGWEQAHDPHGCVYFVNHTTKETTWLDPRTQRPVQPTQVHNSTAAVNSRIDRLEHELRELRGAGVQARH